MLQAHKTLSPYLQTAAKLHVLARAIQYVRTLKRARPSASMGGRGRARYTATVSKGKGAGGGTPRAVAKEATVHVGLLLAFPGEDGSILLHRQGTRNDGQVLEKQSLIHLLTKDSHELLNRPAKGLSMLCGSMTHGLLALERLDTSLCQRDRRALVPALQSLGTACTALDATKKGGETTEGLSAAIQQIFSYVTHAEPAVFQRLAVLGAQIYVTAMQLLEAGTQATLVVGKGESKRIRKCYSGKDDTPHAWRTRKRTYIVYIYIFFLRIPIYKYKYRCMKLQVYSLERASLKVADII